MGSNYYAITNTCACTTDRKSISRLLLYTKKYNQRITHNYWFTKIFSSCKIWCVSESESARLKQWPADIQSYKATQNFQVDG